MADVIFKNQFASKQAKSKVAKPSGYVSKYSTRPDAVQAYIADKTVYDDLVRHVFYQFDANSKYSSQHLLNQELKYMGTAFDMTNVACSREQVLALARGAQAAYDRGATVREFVISFDNDFLSKYKLLDDTIDPELVVPGMLFGHVDETNIRLATQHMLKTLTSRLNMDDPKVCCAVQTDTGHVHIHGVMYDDNPSVKNDRGFIPRAQLDFACDMLAHELKQTTSHVYNPLQGLRWAVEVQQQSKPLKELNLRYALAYSDIQAYQEGMVNYVSHPDRSLTPTLLDSVAKETVAVQNFALYSHVLKGKMNRRFVKQVVNEYSEYLNSKQISKAAEVMAPYFKGELALYGKRTNYHQYASMGQIYAKYYRNEQMLTQLHDDLLQQRNKLMSDLNLSTGDSRYARHLLLTKKAEFSDDLSNGLLAVIHHHRPLQKKHLTELSTIIGEDKVKNRFEVNFPLQNYLVRQFQAQVLQYQFLLFENGALPGEELGQDLLNVPEPTNPSEWLSNSDYRKRIVQSDYANDIYDYGYSVSSKVRFELLSQYYQREEYIHGANLYLQQTNQSLDSLKLAIRNQKIGADILQPTKLVSVPIETKPMLDKTVQRLDNNFVDSHLSKVIDEAKLDVNTPREDVPSVLANDDELAL